MLDVEEMQDIFTSKFESLRTARLCECSFEFSLPSSAGQRMLTRA